MYNKLAKLLVNYSLKLKSGERFAILGPTNAEPLIKELAKEALNVGALPHLALNIPGIQEYFLKNANETQLKTADTFKKIIFEEFDALLSIWGESNTKSLSRVDPRRLGTFSKVYRPLRNILSERELDGKARWCGTLFPTEAYAMDSNMSLDEFKDIYFKACHLFDDDPTNHWLEREKAQQTLVDWLTGKKELHIIGDGTNLKMNVAGRTWVNASGKCNFPDGEVFSGPHSETVEGEVRFSFPACHLGYEVEDVRLIFEKGRIIKESASKNLHYLQTILNTDDGARYLGEIAIGTNRGIKEFTKNILLDEKMGGTVHMAIGAGIPETGNRNQSAIHIDMICDLRDGGKVVVDGTVLMENSLFVPKELQLLNRF